MRPADPRQRSRGIPFAQELSRDQLDAAGIEVMNSSIVERAAYRDLLDFGGLALKPRPQSRQQSRQGRPECHGVHRRGRLRS